MDVCEYGCMDVCVYRVKSNGMRVFKWGCTGDGANSSCVEENRNRKKKSCCHTSFCNQNISTSWLKGGGDNVTMPTEATPTEATPTEATPTTADGTRPPPPVLTFDTTPNEDRTNCSRRRRRGSHSPDIESCPGPGSVPPELVPDTVVPVSTELVPMPTGGIWSESL